MNISRLGTLSLEDVKFVPDAEGSREERLVRKGDVLFNNTNSADLVGKTALYVLDEEWGFSNHMTRLRVDPSQMDPAYLALSLHSRWRRGYFKAICNNHVSQASVSRKALLDTEIAVPPLSEQRAIVARVGGMSETSHHLRSRLTSAEETGKRLRRALALTATLGRLTEGWREAHPAETTAAAEVAERISARTPRPGQGEFAPPSTKPRPVEVTDLPEIPPEWMWAYLPDCGYMGRGRSRHRPRNAEHLFGGAYPFIQTGDVARSGGRIVSHSQTYNDAGLEQSRLWPAGTVCITIAANIANSAILTYPACFPDSVVGAIPDLCSPEYLELFIRTARSELERFAPATSQKNINIGILSEVAVPIPPRREQVEIVRRAELAAQLLDSVDRHLEEAAVRIEELPAASLADAV